MMRREGAVTLQINVCAGDLAYAEQTVPELIARHRTDVDEVLVVADGCRPQSTPAFRAEERFPPTAFAARLDQLAALCARWECTRLVDRIVWLRPDAAVLRPLNRKYTGVGARWSHDHLGHAHTAYFLGWEVARHRYVAHFDADIVLWQQRGFSWIRTAIDALAADRTLLAASPRIAPPLGDGRMVEVNAPGSGWLSSWPLERVDRGWRSTWFSTRCHLMDRERLQAMLPLVPRPGKTCPPAAAIVNAALMPMFQRGIISLAGGRLARGIAHRLPPYPLPPEVMLHERAAAAGAGCLYLGDRRAWFIHPDTKPDRYLELLPRLLQCAGGDGVVPGAQRGVSGVRFDAWDAGSGGSSRPIPDAGES